MEKILFLVDQKGIDKSALDFACYLADITHSKLNGIFMDPENFRLGMAEKILYESGEKQSAAPLFSEPFRNTSLAEHKRAFALACSSKGIRCLENKDSIFSAADIVKETRFADLLIIGGQTSIGTLAETPPTALVKEILSKSECAVIIAPLDFTGIEEVIFAYDGSESSMYAIKQFTYLFPQFSVERVIYLQVNNQEGDEVVSHEKFSAFLQMHYSAVGYHVLHGKAGDELFAYLLTKKNILVVIGAYGRSAVSTALRKSTAELLLKTTPLAVFITHH